MAEISIYLEFFSLILCGLTSTRKKDQCDSEVTCLIGCIVFVLFPFFQSQSACNMRMAGIEDTADMLEKQLASELSQMNLEEAFSLARAFSHSLNLMGIAETHHWLVDFPFTCYLFIYFKTRFIWNRKITKEKRFWVSFFANLRSCYETNRVTQCCSFVWLAQKLESKRD